MAPNVKDSTEVKTSFPELSYPTLRDGSVKNGDQWIRGKIIDDGAEDLWRVHDKIYDLSNFTKVHPGGEFWLKRTKGTDITEAFESHHMSSRPELMLPKFYIKDAATPRNSPFTFENNGFYAVLRSRIRKELKELPKALVEDSKGIMDALVVITFALAVLTCRTNFFPVRIILCILTGLFQTWTVNCAHNFTHQKDNWRMYWFNLSFNPTREWRIGHALSHHMFPNTLLDQEISVYEPYFLWLPRKSKNIFQRYAPRLYAAVVYTFIVDFLILSRLMLAFTARKLPGWHIEDLFSFSVPTVMYIFGGCQVLQTFFVWVGILHASSFFFTLIGLNAAHHHPDIFHDGDDHISDRDWGLHQIEAVMDRVDVNGSLLLVLTNFGDHCLHHLFPAVDHAYLPKLYPVFWETCKEFQTRHKISTQFELFLGQFQQLARVEPKKIESS